MWRARSLLLSTVFAGAATAQTVEFFYTETLDTCAINGASIQANEQTTHGGVCAYQRDVDRVYGCPAPDPMCWTWAQDCNENSIGQTVCNRGGTVFCCNAVAGETCTTTEGQINVCISNFTSPNSGVSLDDANTNYLAAVNTDNVTATSQSVDPTPFSTRNLISTAAQSSSPTTSKVASVSPSETYTISGPSSAGLAGATSTSGVAATTDNSSPLSGGAIAGIVIGALAAIAIIGGAFFLLGRRKRRHNRDSLGSKDMPGTGSLSTGQDIETKKTHEFYGNVSTASELGSEGNTRVEMPATYATHPNPNARTHHELE